MIKCPCKNCITFSICHSIIRENYLIAFPIGKLICRCSLFKEYYDQYNWIDLNPSRETFDEKINEVKRLFNLNRPYKTF